MNLRSSKRKVNKNSCVKTNTVFQQKKCEELDSSESSSDECEVETILDKRQYSKTIQYLIKWKDFHDSENSWVNVENLNCPDLLKKFEKKFKREQKRKAENKKKKKDLARNEKEREEINGKTFIIKSSKDAYSSYDSKFNNSLDDFVVKNDARKKQATKDKSDEREIIKERICADFKSKDITDDAELGPCEIVKKRHHVFGVKNTHKNVESKKNEVIKRHDSRAKDLVDNVQSDVYEMARKRHNDSRIKDSAVNFRPDVREIVKKRHNDSVKKQKTQNAVLDVHENIRKNHNDHRVKHSAGNILSDTYEVVKKRHDDSGSKPTIQNVQLQLREIVMERHDDSRIKQKTQNAQLDVHQRTSKRPNDHRGKHSSGDIPSDAHEIVKKRCDGFSQKKPKPVQNSTRKSLKTTALAKRRSQKIPKIQHLHYFVKAPEFPKKRKNATFSVMGVTFKGTDVLKGLEHFVDTGIAVGPLPDHLYNHPIKTGKTSFAITV